MPLRPVRFVLTAVLAACLTLRAAPPEGPQPLADDERQRIERDLKALTDRLAALRAGALFCPLRRRRSVLTIRSRNGANFHAPFRHPPIG